MNNPEQSAQPPARERRNRAAVFGVILAALAIWFAYDGWFNPAIQAKGFNKVGAVVLAAAAIYQFVCCARAHKAMKSESPLPASPPPEEKQ